LDNFVDYSSPAGSFLPVNPPEKKELDEKRASLPMTEFAMSLVGYFQDKREATWETFVRIVFSTFIGGLVLLLVLLYAGVPLV
jgi:hypothetical protein